MKRALIPILAFLSAIAAIIVVLSLSSPRPVDSLQAFFAGPFSSPWHLGVLLDRAALLLLAALGASAALKAGAFNLGGEAQIYAPALLTAAILAPGGNPAFARLMPAAAFAAAIGLGALLGGIPGILRARRATSELLTSFLLSAAVVPVVDYLIQGPLRDPERNLLATRAIARQWRVGDLLPGLQANIFLPFSLLLAALLFFFLRNTAPGFRYRLTGTAPEFSRSLGYPARLIPAAGMALSGAFHGAAGFAAVTGTWFMCHTGLTAGMGWSALAVALIARANPLAAAAAAFLYAWLETASETALLSSRFSFDSASLVQGLIFLVVSARTLKLPSFFREFKPKKARAHD